MGSNNISNEIMEIDLITDINTVLRHHWGSKHHWDSNHHRLYIHHRGPTSKVMSSIKVCITQLLQLFSYIVTVMLYRVHHAIVENWTHNLFDDNHWLH
jgi:hypothetical protein